MSIKSAPSRARFALGILSLMAAPLFSGAAQAQAVWPMRPIRLIVAYAAGGGADIMARLVAAPLAKELGQPVVVENRAGAGGAIGTDACAKAAPDGYTFCFGSIATHSIIPYLQTVSYDPLKDFAPISLLAYYPSVIAVNPRLPIHNIDELFAYARQHPGMGYGTSGVGTSNHLTGEFLNRRFSLGLTHVPYRGGNQAQTDAIAGQIPVVIDQITAMVPHFESGALRPLLVVGSEKRSPLLPAVPTINEKLLPDFRIQGYQGIFAPAGLPAEIAAKMSETIRHAVDGTDVRQKLIDMGSEVVLSTPEAFATSLRETAPMYRDLVAASGAKAE